jgi:predicted dehydrogenase
MDAELSLAYSDLHNKVIMVNHLMLFHPAFVKMKELCLNGDLGLIWAIRSCRSQSKVRPEGLFWNIAPHDVSMVYSLFGEPHSVRKVENRIWMLYEGYNEMFACFVVIADLAFKDIGPKERWFSITGTKGVAVFDDLAPEKLTVNGEAIPLPVVDPLAQVARAFLERIETKAGTVASGQEGLAVTRIIERALA